MSNQVNYAAGHWVNTAQSRVTLPARSSRCPYRLSGRRGILAFELNLPICIFLAAGN